MTNELHTRRILDKVAESNTVSQRSLSRELGIALGLTNLLLRRLVAKGWIRIVRLRANQVRYVLTPAGITQKARLSRNYFLQTVRFYTEARDRVERRFAEMVRETHGGSQCSIVFCGAGEVAEVGWVCAQRTSLRLIGIVDDLRAGQAFFGLTVMPLSALVGDQCDGVHYDRVVVTTTDQDAALQARLGRAGVDTRNVVWL